MNEQRYKYLFSTAVVVGVIGAFLVTVFRMPIRHTDTDKGLGKKPNTQGVVNDITPPHQKPTVFESVAHHFRITLPENWNIIEHDSSWFDLVNYDSATDGFVRIVQEATLASVSQLWIKQLQEAGTIEQSQELFHSVPALKIIFHRGEVIEPYWIIERGTSVFVIHAPDTITSSFEFTQL